MIQFMTPTPSPDTPFPMEFEPSLVSASTSRTSSWSTDADPQLFAPDSAFWQDMSTYVCSSPHSNYEYAHDDPSTSPDDFKAAPRNNLRRVRSKDQSPEVILRRRAQNRASQRAYRDRKDRRVKELETQLDEMNELNEQLRRERDEISAAHEKLKEEQARWKEEREGKETVEDGRWRTETCLSPILSTENKVSAMGKNGAEKEHGETSLMVKVMICKRCFGEGTGSGGCES